MSIDLGELLACVIAGNPVGNTETDIVLSEIGIDNFSFLRQTETARCSRFANRFSFRGERYWCLSFYDHTTHTEEYLPASLEVRRG